MDINNLHAFLEVAEKRSFSRSAESLKLTQPAVSKRIAALEAELASRLFDRVGRRVHLTEAGKVLLPSALKISSEVARVESEISCMGKEVGGKLSIGAAEHVGLDRFAMVLKSYKQKFPNVELDLQFPPSADALTNTESGLLDVSFCAVSDTSALANSQSRINSAEVWSERLKVMTDSAHPLASLREVTPQQLAQFPAILPKKNSVVRSVIEEAMGSHQADLVVAMEASDFPTARSMACIGLGWACLPAAERGDTLVPINLVGVDLTYSIAIVKSSDRTLSRAAQAFIESLPVSVAG